MNPSLPPIPSPQPREEAIQATVLAATQAFHRREASRPLSQLEFIHQQGKLIHKRWWSSRPGFSSCSGGCCSTRAAPMRSSGPWAP